MNKREFLTKSSVLLAGTLITGCKLKSGTAMAKSGQPDVVRRRYVSLKVLQKGILDSCQSGTCADDALLHLAGLTGVDGVLIDRASSDLLVFGPIEPGRPVVPTADLVVALRSATGRYRDAQGYVSAPGVSLDPQPEVIARLQRFDISGLGGDDQQAARAMQDWKSICQSPQTLRIIGLPREPSHYLLIITLRDVDLKSYVDGTIKLQELEVPSQIMLARHEAAVKRGAKTPAAGFRSSRYWFNAGKAECAVNAEAAMLLKCDIKVSTEAQMLASNKLVDSSQRDELADRCAASFTKLLPGLKTEPQWQELYNIYRIQGLANTIVKRSMLREAGLNLDPLLDRWQVPTEQVPAQVPGRWAFTGADFRRELANGYAISKVRIPSCGGVDVNPLPAQLDYARNQHFTEANRVALAARPEPNAVFWDVEVPNIIAIA